MIKQLIVILLLLCGLANNTFGGAYALGSIYTSAPTLSTTKPVYGIAGYILVSPVSLNTTGHGVLYHTHTNISQWGYETIIYYGGGATGTVSIKSYTWAKNNQYKDYLHPTYGNGTTTIPVPPQWSHTDYDIQLAVNGTWSAGALKYLTDITIGTETKKAILFQNISFFQQYAGTTTGAWREYIAIKNFVAQTMELKWAQKWDGTKAENGNPSHPSPKWAGSLETFNYDSPGSATTYNSSGTASVGNANMAFINKVGIPQLMDSANQTLRTSDTADNTGLIVYSPSGANAFAWLGKVP